MTLAERVRWPLGWRPNRFRTLVSTSAGRVLHPNVVQTLDVVSHGDELLLVMEYVHGETLWRLARAARARGLHVPVPIALAIVTAGRNHQRKIRYMSPEHLSGDAVTRRSDVFATGVVLWELLTGRRLLLGGADGESMLVKTLLEGTFDPPSRYRRSIDPALDAIVLCGLERDPAARFASASEMARTLEGVSLIATSTQVGEWVQSLAGDTLAERGRKMNAFERADGKRTASRVSLEMPVFVEPAPSPSAKRRIAMVVGAFALGMAYTAGIAWALQMREPTRRAWTEASEAAETVRAAANVDSAIHARKR